MRITPKLARWAVPLLQPVRYKGIKGGRSGGKSHQCCEIAAERLASKPDYKVAGIREIQKSIKYSLKSLLEKKIYELGASYLFDMQDQEIKRRGGDGVAIFLGMQDHTADSVKGLEDFDLGLVDEANSLSKTSLGKLTPTFRKQGSEILFAWNPDQETDPIDTFFRENEGHSDFLLIHVNITDNPFASETAIAEYRREKERADAARERASMARANKGSPDDADLAIIDTFEHVWRGGYNKRSQGIVFHNWRKQALDVPEDIIWFYGVDWGFSTDPTAGTKSCILPPRGPKKPHILYFRKAISQTGVRNEDLPDFLSGLDGIEKWPSRADSARPETIDYVRRHGLPKMRPAKKGKGSVEDGIAFLQGMDIVIHPDDCAPLEKELKSFSYKVVKHTGEILPVVEDANNHCIDSARYGLEGAHRKGKMLPTMLDVPRKRDRYERDDEEEGLSWRVI